MIYRCVRPFILKLFFISFAFFLQHCGSTAIFTGVVFKGPVRRAVINFHKLNPDGTEGPLSQTFIADESGAFDFELSNIKQILPTSVVVSGGEFIDEASGDTITLSKEYPLRIYIGKVEPSSENIINVSPLTTLVTSLSNTFIQKGVSQADAFQKSQALLDSYFNLKEFSRLTPPDLTNKKIDTISQDTLYSLVIAGISQQLLTILQTQDDSSVHVLHFVDALVKDIEDGIFDGKDTNNQHIMLGSSSIPLSSTAMTTGLVQSIKDFLKSSRNQSGLKEDDTTVSSLLTHLQSNSTSLLKISLTPENQTLYIGQGETKQLEASTQGFAENSLLWSVNGVEGGSSDVGTISQTGLYTAPNNIPSSGMSVTIKAQSKLYSKVYSEVSIQLKVALSLSPQTASIKIKEEKEFEVTVIPGAITLEFLINDVLVGNETLGTTEILGNGNVLYKAPKKIEKYLEFPLILKVRSILAPENYAISEITLYKKKEDDDDEDDSM